MYEIWMISLACLCMKLLNIPLILLLSPPSSHSGCCTVSSPYKTPSSHPSLYPSLLEPQWVYCNSSHLPDWKCFIWIQFTREFSCYTNNRLFFFFSSGWIKSILLSGVWLCSYPWQSYCRMWEDGFMFCFCFCFYRMLKKLLADYHPYI